MVLISCLKDAIVGLKLAKSVRIFDVVTRTDRNAVEIFTYTRIHIWLLIRVNS